MSTAGTKPVVLLFEPIHQDAIDLLRKEAEVRMAKGLSESELLDQVADVEAIIIRANGRVSRRVMEAAPKLRVVGRHGTGVEAIDREAADQLGITVVNTPEANVESVAEHALGMMIALAKRMMEADRALRAGDWQARYRLTGHELHGKTLGVLGFGRIGTRLAEIACLSLQMEVLYYDQVAYPESEAKLGAKRLELTPLLERADVISVHVPLLQSTTHLLGEEAFRAMKPTCLLINTSRGPVVDQSALIAALQAGQIAGAGLDVFDPEPLPADHPLLQLENVVLSPHMAAHTDEALRRMAMVAKDILAVLNGEEPTYRVR